MIYWREVKVISLAPILTEIEKGNYYLEIAGRIDIDFLLVIDLDGYAVKDYDKFSKNLGKIKEYETTSYATGKMVRDTSDVYGIKIFEKHFEQPGYIIEGCLLPSQ